MPYAWNTIKYGQKYAYDPERMVTRYVRVDVIRKLNSNGFICYLVQFLANSLSILFCITVQIFTKSKISTNHYSSDMFVWQNIKSKCIFLLNRIFSTVVLTEYSLHVTKRNIKHSAKINVLTNVCCSLSCHENKIYYTFTLTLLIHSKVPRSSCEDSLHSHNKIHGRDMTSYGEIWHPLRNLEYTFLNVWL